MAGRHSIGKSFAFDVCHLVDGVPQPGQPGRLHGHTYTAEVQLTADELIGPGFVADFGDLKPFGAYIARVLDHRSLNEVLEGEPTRRHLAGHLESWFRAHMEPAVTTRLAAIRLYDPLPEPEGTRFVFRAAHRLDGLAEGHQCGRLHGHTYTVHVAGPDRARVGEPPQSFGAYLSQSLDHQHLNDVLGFQPTSERLAEHLALRLGNGPEGGGRAWTVRVSETPSSWAQFCLPGGAG